MMDPIRHSQLSTLNSRPTVAVVFMLAMIAPAPHAFAQDAATRQLLEEADRYYDQAEYERAASNFDRAIRAQPKDVPPAAYAKRASIFLFSRDYAAGLSWITSVAERTWPGDDAILEQKAVILSRLEGRKKDALEVAERVVKRRPSSYTLHILLGDAYYQQGPAQAEQTAAHYEAYLRTRPGDLAGQDGLPRVKLGFAFLHLGRYAEAERQLDEALRGFGGDANIAANARKGLCAAYAGERRWDRALTVCEKVIGDRRALRGDASPQYNVGVAYLNRDRLDEAMRAADAYIAQRPREPKGYVLRAQVHLRRNRLPEAEAQLNQAESFAPNDPEVARELGRVYLRQKRAGKAIDKLGRAVSSRPEDVETVGVLAEAYLADGQGQNAATQAEKALKVPGQERNPQLLALAGEGYYVAGQLPTARSTLDRALAAAKAQGLPPDARTRTLLVDTINRQAGERFAADDVAGAKRLLLEAREIDPDSTRTHFNLGLVAVHEGEHEAAIGHLEKRLARTPQDLLTNRLIAKAYLGAGREAKAAEHYAKAATEAQQRRNLGVLAEINTEWAPLLVNAGKLDDAVERLEQAVAAARNQPFERAARRNLALATGRRGYERLRARRGADAVQDLETATREPGVLVGTELDAFTFALGLAYLESGQQNRASSIFQALGRGEKKEGLSFLKAPFDQVGADFFAAYTLYREPSATARNRAVPMLERLAGKTGGATGAKVREILRSTHEFLAFDAWGRGQQREAEAALRRAAGGGSGERRAALEHNLAVIDAEQKGAAARGALARFADRVPEALVNLGILADRAGDTKEAHDLWTQARSRGARASRLDEWIDSKKRLFGY
jgi:tetratricopeptide (TPR) repeat protein